MSVVYRDVLERFVKYREQRNISQNELAQMLCISQSYVSKMEVGKARICVIKSEKAALYVLYASNSACFS